MKVVILAGGFGTRFSEETSNKPKPMIMIGEKPIIWHIMNYYSNYGFNDFIVCAGYKSNLIKEFFLNYYPLNSDFEIDLKTHSIKYLKSSITKWKVSIIDTGLHTMTGGRLKKISNFIDGPFMMTYGDGLANVNLDELYNFHKNHRKLATVTAVRPPARFGAIKINKMNDKVDFIEKPVGDNGWINGGFFVLNPDIFDLIEGDESIWEVDCMHKLAKNNQISAFLHEDFFHPMDSLRDHKYLSNLWNQNIAPWKVW